MRIGQGYDAHRFAAGRRLVLGGVEIEHDREGYITNVNNWSEELAYQLAADESIELNDEHWEVINFLREYYEEYQIAPAVRVSKIQTVVLRHDIGHSGFPVIDVRQIPFLVGFKVFAVHFDCH